MTATSLLLVAHGFPRRPQARHPAHDHAERLAGVGPFEEVLPALLNGEPSVADALQSVPAGRVVVVPLFVSDGYFVGTALPDRVESCRPEGVTVEYAGPIGTHEEMTDVIVRRALSAVDGPPETTDLAVLGHGSEHGSANREAVESHAHRIDAHGIFGDVRSFFVEEEPRVAVLPTECAREEVVAVPLFVAEGHHVRADIPDQLGLQGASGTVEGTLITRTDPVGTDPAVAGIAFERAMAALREDDRAQVSESTSQALDRPWRNAR